MDSVPLRSEENPSVRRRSNSSQQYNQRSNAQKHQIKKQALMKYIGYGSVYEA
jgi:hypothetical protein